MEGGQKENPGARATQPGQSGRYMTAAGSRKIARSKAKGQRGAAYRVTPDLGDDPFDIDVAGRNAWALNRLIGAAGITPMQEPTGPRWSAHVFALRAMGVPIDTITEHHEGPFPGWHGRYVLRARVVKGGTA